MPDKLLYTLVARGTVVLSEHSVISGNVNIIALRILEKISPEDGRTSYTQEKYMFHVLVENGITFLCVADQGFGRRIPYAHLNDIKTRFFHSYGESCREAVAYEYNSEFGRVLAERMHFYSNDPRADTINRVKEELSDVKSVMVENIEKVLERGEKLQLLVDKTENLSNEAFTFRREARRLKHTLWWQNARMWLMVSGGVALLVYFLLAMACGFTFSHC